MKRVQRTFRGTTKDYPVYTKKEAQKMGICFVHWKEVSGKGDYALSDDGWVAEVLSFKGPYKRGDYTVTLPYTRYWRERQKLLQFSDYYGKGHYSQRTKGDWVDSEMRTTRTRRAIRLYASVMFAKGEVPRADLERIAEMWRPDQKEPIATFKRLLRQRKIKKMITDELKTILLENGVDMDFVVKSYKEVYEKATEAKSYGVAKSVIDRFSDLLDLEGKGSRGPQPPALEGDRDNELRGLLEERGMNMDEPAYDDSEFLDAEVEEKA